MIYTAFPGTGKTYAANNYYGAVDLESSDYQWKDLKAGVESSKGENKVKNDEWPLNYINAIEEADLYENVFISAQPIVLDILAGDLKTFVTITPHVSEKESYLKAYRHRGSSDKFIRRMEDHFEEYVDDLDNNDDALCHIKIEHGTHISDLIRGGLI